MEYKPPHAAQRCIEAHSCFPPSWGMGEPDGGRAFVIPLLKSGQIQRYDTHCVSARFANKRILFALPVQSLLNRCNEAGTAHAAAWAPRQHQFIAWINAHKEALSSINRLREPGASGLQSAHRQESQNSLFSSYSPVPMSQHRQIQQVAHIGVRPSEKDLL